MKNSFTFNFFIKINKFILLLKKGVSPYEILDDWEKVNKIQLLEKEELYSNLNMGDI